MLGFAMFAYILGVYISWLFIASKLGRSAMLDITILVLGVWGFFEVAGRFV